MFKGQPKGLYALALANTGERFGYYTMLAIFILFIQAKFGYSAEAATQIYGFFLAAVYAMPLVGGFLADKIGYGKCVTIGIVVMFTGYLCMSIPTDANFLGKALMFGALGLIALGTGLFKGNLQVMVGNLYDDPKYSSKRDAAFSLFYMAINIGAMFAPSAASAITNFFLKNAGLTYNSSVPALSHQLLDQTISPERLSALEQIAATMKPDMPVQEFAQYYIAKLSEAYNYGFAVACLSLILSISIYMVCRSWFKHAEESNVTKKTTDSQPVAELSKEETKSRMIALFFVFGVVIFFWMAFHQNGSTLTFFARDYTQHSVAGIERLGFNIGILALLALSVYSLFSVFQSKTINAKAISGLVTLALWGGAYLVYSRLDAEINILPQTFQQFNPFFVVALTPFSLALFSYLASIKKEPSAPRKIGMGMIVAACGFGVMTFASLALQSPKALNGAESPLLISPNYLIGTYLVLTFAELLLSPMGISFVSKVAPPKYKGAMMGGWFVATAIGNYLTFIPGLLWNKTELYIIWAILAGLCVVSALAIFAFMKQLEKATK